jgi:hypothetical protein
MRSLRVLALGALASLAFVALWRTRADATGEFPTARAFLADYHGDAWPALERAIEAAGEDLDQPYRFHEWTAVAERFEPSFRLAPEELAAWIEHKVGWPAGADVAWVEERYALGRATALTADDLAFLEAAVADANLALLDTASLWALTLQAHVLARWHAGAFARAPFTTAGLDTGRGTFSRSIAGYGWAVTLTLLPEDHPDLTVLEEELARRTEERDCIVLDFLQGIAAR